MSFTYIETEDCIKFYKRVYTLDTPISMDKVNKLSKFGKLNIKDFSKIVPNGKILYHIENKDNKLSIRGAVGSKNIHVVIPKKDEKLLKNFEETISK